MVNTVRLASHFKTPNFGSVTNILCGQEQQSQAPCEFCYLVDSSEHFLSAKDISR
jgi:hypothetical protein